MTFYAKNGSGDNFYYGRWEDEATYERYIAMLDGSELSRYGRYCGWMQAEGAAIIDENTMLITNVVLDVIAGRDAGGSTAFELVKLGDVSELEKLDDMQTGAWWDDFDDVLEDY